jgi:hypothetical protein
MLEGDREVLARAGPVEKLVRLVCDEDERPYFVSDEATLFDVCTSTPEVIADRLAAHYGRRVRLAELRLPRFGSSLTGSALRAGDADEARSGAFLVEPAARGIFPHGILFERVELLRDTHDLIDRKTPKRPPVLSSENRADASASRPWVSGSSR